MQVANCLTKRAFKQYDIRYFYKKVLVCWEYHITIV